MFGLDLTFLGTGTSVGVPMVGCSCEVCNSKDPRDRRLRCSVFLKTADVKVLIDCGPDLRQQCLREKITSLDAIFITHPHADHIMGFDDLRRFTTGLDQTLPVYAQPSCLKVLKRIFFYIFNGENRYPGYFNPDPHPVEGVIKLGRMEVIPIPIEHGKVECLGFLFRKEEQPVLAYLPDCKRICESGMSLLQGVECLVIDALRQSPHPTHMSIGEAISVASELSSRQTWLTHVSHEVMHERDEAVLPEGVRIAYDGLKLEL